MVGTEFGPEQENFVLVVRAVYVLKFYGADFRDLLDEQLHDLGYRPSIADPGVWMRPSVKPCVFMYYEYVLCYVDDVLCISDDPIFTNKGMQVKFKLKGDNTE